MANDMLDEIKICDAKGELFKAVRRYMSNNYRKMHHIPLIRKGKRVILKPFEINKDVKVNLAESNALV